MIILVGEDNPYGSDPRYALYDEPKHSAGGRLRRMVFGIPKRVYFDRELFERGNLCTGKWKMKEARQQAYAVLRERPDATIIMFGRKVATAFSPLVGARTPPLECFEVRDRLMSLPHPSGLNRQWADPETLKAVRYLLTAHLPHIPWGSLDPKEEEDLG